MSGPLGARKVQKSKNMSLPTCSYYNVEGTGTSDRVALNETTVLLIRKVKLALFFQVLPFRAASNSSRIFIQNAKILLTPRKASWNLDIAWPLPFQVLVRDDQNISKVLNKLSLRSEKVQQDWSYARSCEVRMVEELSTAVSTFGLEYYHFYHEVKLYLIHELKGLCPIRMAILLFYLLKPSHQVGILYAALLQAYDFYDFFELIDLVLSLEQSHPRHEIMENTAQSPHIHRFPIMLRPKQQLRRSIKQRSDHVGHLPPHKIQLFSHSVIDDLDMVIVGIDICGIWLRDEVTFLGYKHDVGRLEISMNYLIPMKFLNSLQDLLKNLLYRELLLPHDHFIQVYSQPLHHHHWLIFAYKRVNHSYQVFPTQDL